MANKESAAGFYFELFFRGENVAFQEVSGIAKELNIEEVLCGGENRFKYRLSTISSSQNLVLKKASIPEGALLNDWCSNCIEDGLTSKITTQDISLSLLDATGMVYEKWTFHNAYPVKYAVSDLKSQENEIVIESIELAYTYFEIAPTSMFGNSFD